MVPTCQAVMCIRIYLKMMLLTPILGHLFLSRASLATARSRRSFDPTASTILNEAALAAGSVRHPSEQAEPCDTRDRS